MTSEIKITVLTAYTKKHQTYTNKYAFFCMNRKLASPKKIIHKFTKKVRNSLAQILPELRMICYQSGG